MTTKFSLSQLRTLPPLTFYKSELHIPAFRKGGWVNGGLCPFHADKQQGSFYINTNSGAFKCFACYTKGGDIIAFVQCRYGLSFVEATKHIAAEWGAYV